MKVPQKGKAIQRAGNVLYVCKLCLYRSQNTYLARQFITDLQEDQACLKAEEDASNNADDVIGIASVDITAMKVKATRTEPNAILSRALATPNAGKTDEAAYKSIIGTISAPAQKHALSSKTLNNAPSLVLKQKTPTFKQQEPLQLTLRPQLQEQARRASSRAESIEEIFGEESTKDIFGTTNVNQNVPRKRLTGTTTSSPNKNVENDDPSGLFYSEEEPFNDPKQLEQVESGKVETIEIVSEGDQVFNSPGVLSEGADLEEDTQFRIGDEEYNDSVDVDHINDDSDNDGEDCEDHDDETEQDAQSLGISPPSSDLEDQNNDVKAVEHDNQSNEKRAKGL